VAEERCNGRACNERGLDEKEQTTRKIEGGYKSEEEDDKGEVIGRKSSNIGVVRES